MSRIVFLLAFVVALELGGGGSVVQAAQTDYHPAYGGCLSWVDDLDCAEIGYAVV